MCLWNPTPPLRGIWVEEERHWSNLKHIHGTKPSIKKPANCRCGWKKTFASPTLNREQQNTTKASQSVWRNKQERLSRDDRVINEGICAMLSPSQTRVASWFSSGHFPSHIVLQTKQNLNCLIKWLKTGFMFWLKPGPMLLSTGTRCEGTSPNQQHTGESSSSRPISIRQCPVSISNTHIVNHECESIPTQSSKASACDGTGSSHITRAGKRAHLQALSALMEACKLAATRVTPQVVIGLGSISRVNKSCHCALVRESTFTWPRRPVCNYFLSTLPEHTCLSSALQRSALALHLASVVHHHGSACTGKHSFGCEGCSFRTRLFTSDSLRPVFFNVMAFPELSSHFRDLCFVSDTLTKELLNITCIFA